MAKIYFTKEEAIAGKEQADYIKTIRAKLIDKLWWFNRDKWEQNAKARCSSYQDCRTVKAFRRKLKSAPRGVECVLVSRWAGCDVIGVGGL